MALKSLLIIDDDRNLRQSMALVLRRADYQVDTAGTAAEAVAALEATQYDLVILDSLMPDDDSIFLPRLLSLYPDLSVLVLTTQTTRQTSSETEHPGVHFRMTKPVTPEALLKRVKTILKKGAAGSTAGHKRETILL